jgi:threonine synthase
MFQSTNRKSKLVSFREAVFKGTADDGGLFMPVEIPKLPNEFLTNINNLSFQEISFFIAKNLIGDEIPSNELKKLIDESINFDTPLVGLDNNIGILELFHGPTLAFKDFGARFLAKVLFHFNRGQDRDINILVATSGDTGSAVASGFYNIKGIKVFLLYPSGKVSHIQEQQLCTFGGNITALEVEGTFDDCQRMVKQAFESNEINEKLVLTSANSINFARLLPQSFYYFYAYRQTNDKTKPLIFSVPCGNFGNLTGGLIAERMGLPVFKFIAATNINDVFPMYLKTKTFAPKPSIMTISNAMDVGNPSNFSRIMYLFDNWGLISEKIFGASFSDELTINAMKEIFEKYNYIIDPHGAVGFLGLKKYIELKKMNHLNGIILETAHPAKFVDTVEKAIQIKIKTPSGLEEILKKKKASIRISNNFSELKEILLN